MSKADKFFKRMERPIELAPTTPQWDDAMTDKPTPRTQEFINTEADKLNAEDANSFKYAAEMMFRLADFARQLERELDEARARIVELGNGAYGNAAGYRKLAQANEALTAENAELKKANDQLYAHGKSMFDEKEALTAENARLSDVLLPRYLSPYSGTPYYECRLCLKHGPTREQIPHREHCPAAIERRES